MRLVGVMLIIFATDDLVDHIDGVATGTVPTGIMGFMVSSKAKYLICSFIFFSRVSVSVILVLYFICEAPGLNHSSNYYLSKRSD